MRPSILSIDFIEDGMSCIYFREKIIEEHIREIVKWHLNASGRFVRRSRCASEFSEIS